MRAVDGRTINVTVPSSSITLSALRACIPQTAINELHGTPLPVGAIFGSLLQSDKRYKKDTRPDADFHTSRKCEPTKHKSGSRTGCLRLSVFLTSHGASFSSLCIVSHLIIAREDSMERVTPKLTSQSTPEGEMPCKIAACMNQSMPAP